MSNIRSGEMLFTMADLYPQTLSGTFSHDTSTLANPEAEDQDVLGEAPEVSDVTGRQPKRMNLFLAIILIVVIALFFGLD